jgi:hypothetical protein
MRLNIRVLHLQQLNVNKRWQQLAVKGLDVREILGTKTMREVMLK